MKRGIPIGIVLWAVASWGQTSSTITGLVTDQTQLPIPMAAISISAKATGLKQTTITNPDGNYAVPALPPGEYIVTGRLEGFKDASIHITVTAGLTGRADLVLVPNDAKQTIQVSAEAPAIDTENSMVSNSVGARELETMPLNGRNVLEMAITIPGISGDLGADEGGVFQDVPTAGAGLSIGGGRASSSSIMADGASATSAGIGRATVTFSPDTVQEVQIITSSFSAKYGNSGGGVINTVSKAGTDQLRGTLYWYHRNPAFHARQFNRPLPPQQRRNESGLILSGPVRIPKLYDGRRRTFFFFSMEPKRWFDAVDIYDRFPTEEERRGDFRNSWVAPGQRRPLLYQQVRCLPTPQDCQHLFPIHRPNASAEYPLFGAGGDPSKVGRVIPEPYLDPNSRKVMAEMPLPNQPFDAQGRNYFGTRGVNGGSGRFSLKLDHAISAANRISGRYTDVPNLADRYRFNKDDLFASYASDRSLTRQWLVTDTHTLSPRIVNELRINYTFSDYSRLPPGDLASRNYTTDKFGLPSQTGWGYPRFNTGFANVGYIGSALGQYIEHQYQVNDDVTVIRGRHTFSAGVDGRVLMLNVKSLGLQDSCCGTYAFTNALTNSGNNNTPGGTGGLAFASFLMGVPNSVTLRGFVIPYYYRWKTGAAYFQDDWKVKSNLTVNVGVRWQYNPPRSEKFNRQASADLEHPVEIRRANETLSGLTFNYTYSGINGRSIYLEPVHKRNFEPRIGFAWSPRLGTLASRRMVLRGGYGISHPPNTGRGRDPLPDFGAGSSGAWGYTRWANNNNNPALTQSRNPQYLLGIGRNPPVVRGDVRALEVPADGLLCHGCTPRDIRVPAGALVVFENKAQSPYVQTWNLTAQWQTVADFVASVTYMGQKGTHLYSPLVSVNNPDPELYAQLLDEGGDPNELVEDPLGRLDNAGNLVTTTRANLLRPFPTAGDINVAGITSSTSIYHAGSISLERRYKRGFLLRTNYTWAKSIDTSSDANLSTANLFVWGTTRLQDAENLKANRSVSTFDMRHRVNVVMNWELPLGQRRKFLAKGNRWLVRGASGWSVSALASMFSGFPFSPYLGDGNGIPGGASGTERIRPDIIPGAPVINPRWSKSVANDVPYFNPEAFGRPAYGKLGTAARTLDYARNPWKRSVNASLFREFRPFESRQRYLQFRAEFYNTTNTPSFTTTGSNNESPNLFATAPPVSRTGIQLGGPMPYLVNKGAADFPIGTRENLIAQSYNQNFGKFWRDRNGAGRVIQLALKFYF